MSEQQPQLQNQTNEQVQEQMTIEELKDSIHLSANKLLELTYSEEKYVNAIVKFNDQAIEHIDREQQEEALVYLGEAERTLEYGASCGKSIDRNLIISILNNEACCYYREGQLQKCASYLQGVIYNLKAFGTSMQSSPTGSSLLQKNRLKNIDEFYHISLEKKIQLVHYSLRYCTINSQLGKRQVALKAGQNVVKLVKSLFYDIMFENPKIHPLDTNKQEQELKELKQLIKGEQFFKEQIQCEQLDTYRKLTRIYVKKWNQRKISNRVNREFQKYIRDYSISEVIDILPVHYSSNSDSIYESLSNTKVVLRQLLHLSMGYFTISTQHRLLAEHRYPSSYEQKCQSEEWKSANVYHLLGILFLGINLNSDLLFMKQLISSYEQHYKFQLLFQEHLSDEELESLSQKLLFESKRQKNSKQSQILFEKISKLKQKQDNKKSNDEKRIVSRSKSKGIDYKTLNSTKLNISKDITPQTVARKRSISKQETSGLSSSKKLSQKNSMNNSTVNRTKILNETQNNGKLPSRKRSYSKDSVKDTKPLGHLGLQKLNQVEKTANEYQLQTPNKKSLQGPRKRRISSVSSSKEIVLQSQTHRQTSKNTKILAPHDKQKKIHFDYERMKSPPLKIQTQKGTKTRTQKGKQKQSEKEQKIKKKVEKTDKQKELKKKKAPSYYL